MARLGKKYDKGEVIFRQGDSGNCMYVIQTGEVEALAESGGKELRLRTMGRNEFFGEMALFEKAQRTATIRTTKPTRLLTIDKKNFLGGIPSVLLIAQALVSVGVNQAVIRVDQLVEGVAISLSRFFHQPQNFF